MASQQSTRNQGGKENFDYNNVSNNTSLGIRNVTGLSKMDSIKGSSSNSNGFKTINSVQINQVPNKSSAHSNMTQNFS